MAFDKTQNTAAFAKNGLNAWRLGLVGFAIISGGPFGIESAVGQLGAFYAATGLLVMGLLWSAPQCWATSELAIAFPRAVGQVEWVHAVLGRHAGRANSIIMAFWQIVDLPSALVLLSAYVSQGFPSLSAGALYGINFAVLSLALIINALSIDALAWTTGLLSVIVASPFVALAVAGGVRAHNNNGPAFSWPALSPSAAPDGWVSNMPVAMSTLLWCSNGYWALGSLAGEVQDAKRHYRPGLLLSAALAITAFVIPILLASGFSPDYTQWQAGWFVNVGQSIAPWLGDWMLGAAVVNNTLCFLANFGAYARGIAASAARGDFPIPWLAHRTRRFGSPLPALLLLLLTTSLLMIGLGFSTLIVVDSSVALIMCEFLFVAHAVHRWRAAATSSTVAEGCQGEGDGEGEGGSARGKPEGVNAVQPLSAPLLPLEQDLDARHTDPSPSTRERLVPFLPVLLFALLPTTALTLFSAYILASQAWWGLVAAAGLGLIAAIAVAVVGRCEGRAKGAVAKSSMQVEMHADDAVALRPSIQA